MTALSWSREVHVACTNLHGQPSYKGTNPRHKTTVRLIFRRWPLVTSWQARDSCVTWQSLRSIRLHACLYNIMSEGLALSNVGIIRLSAYIRMHPLIQHQLHIWYSTCQHFNVSRTPPVQNMSERGGSFLRGMIYFWGRFTSTKVVSSKKELARRLEVAK